MNRFYELTQELQACPGLAILMEIRSISIAREMNDRNFSDLQNALLSHSSQATTEDSLFTTNPSHDDSEIINVMRLVHNYLASSKTLIDHTRRIVRKLCASMPFIHEYQEKVNLTFLNNPLPKFIQDLRNFTLHRSIPLKGPTVVWNFDQTISAYYKLDRDALSEWTEWSKASKLYLANVKGHLIVHDTIAGYHKIVSEFQSWLEGRLIDVFALEIQEEANLRQAIRELTRNGN